MSQNGTQPVSQAASPTAKPWYAALTNLFKPKAPASNQAAPPNNVNAVTATSGATSGANTNAAGATHGGRRRNKYSRKGKKTRKAKKFNKSRKNRN